MGGAGFPTCVKLKPAKPVDTILLNGCECEPYLTADHRVLLEFADDIIFGLKAILKTTGAEKGIIVIEDNKPDAIELLQEKVANIGNMEVFVARTKYPQGAEKTLIKRVMGQKGSKRRSSGRCWCCRRQYQYCKGNFRCDPERHASDRACYNDNRREDQEHRATLSSRSAPA